MGGILYVSAVGRCTPDFNRSKHPFMLSLKIRILIESFCIRHRDLWCSYSVLIKPLQHQNYGLMRFWSKVAWFNHSKFKLIPMKAKMMMAGLLAAVLPCLTVDACWVPIRIACPNDATSSGILVTIPGAGRAYTDNLGIAMIEVPAFGSYTVCVDTTTLPAGSTLKKACQGIDVVDFAPPVVNFTLGGDFCGTLPPQGPCWLTGGGTIGSGKVPNFSFGGVVYPGCSPNAADGGNWNVVDHNAGLHFQGQAIIVDGCSGVSTQSPKVNVNIIDFHGTGILDGINGQIPVSFVGRAIDNLEPGAGNDMLFIVVTDASNNVVLQIGTSAAAPATINTGNLQIHTSSCAN